MRPRSVLLAVAAGLALADASIVTLALPELLVDLSTTVEGVAAVIGVYTVVLAAALIPVERLAARHGAPLVGAAGFAVFAVASAVCALAGSLEVLLAGRALQAAGGAAALVSVFSLLTTNPLPAPGRRQSTRASEAPFTLLTRDGRAADAGPAGPSARTLWLGAAVLSTAVGPALGGALTQAFSWPAIFVVQVPVALVAAGFCAHTGRHAPAARADEGRPTGPRTPPDWRAGLALGLVSAALSAVLFLLVLLLVAGWAVSPLKAAAAVTVVPAAALLAARVPGDARWRAAAGCALVGLGTLALAYLPDAHLWWTFAPQALAGFGMGLALPALGGELLPERDARDAARLLAIRHAGIAVALAIIAPITAARLDDATQKARERGVALTLDARIDPVRKLTLAPALLASVDAESPRKVLRQTIDANRGTVPAGERPAYDRLGQRADETLVSAVGDAFYAAFAITGLLALAGGALLVRVRPQAPRWAVGAAVAGCVVLTAQIVAQHRDAPAPVTIADPCQPRTLPSTGGTAGAIQNGVLRGLDRTACQLGSSREELVLALANADDAKRFEREHGVDPRSVGGLLRSLGGIVSGLFG